MRGTVKLEHVVGLILAGGRSARLFPFNKVLSDLTGNGKSLLQQAVHRVSGRLTQGSFRTFIPPDHVYILTAGEIVPAMQSHLRWPATRFIVDPVRRGTWPALLWAMAHLSQRDRGQLLAVVTGDHVIGDVPRFRRAVGEALELAQESPTVAMVGVQPSRNPAEWTSFGAFRAGPAASAAGSTVIDFEEKPSEPRASEMIAQGGWLWNAGMFFFRVSTAELALRRFQPGMYETYEKLRAAVAGKGDSAAATVFAEFPVKIPHPLAPERLVDNTIDYAIMTPMVHPGVEDLKATVAKTALLRWNDVGSWPALRAIVKPDRQGNLKIGSVRIGKGVSQCVVAADRGSRVDASGIKGCVAAVSGDQAMVMSVSEVGQIKELTGGMGSTAQPKVTEAACEGCVIHAATGHVLAAGVRDLDIRFEKNVLRIRPR